MIDMRMDFLKENMAGTISFWKKNVLAFESRHTRVLFCFNDSVILLFYCSALVKQADALSVAWCAFNLKYVYIC